MAEADPILNLPEVDSVIYKDYSPYNRRRGEIRRVNGKLIVAYRFLLWAGLTDMDQLVAQIAAMPTDAAKADSYALINVHAWSYANIGGPMEAVSRVVKALGSDTRVVTASQLLAEVKRLR